MSVACYPFDVAAWKATMPVGRDEAPDEYLRPAMSVPPWYTVTPDHVKFRARVDGVTTSGSDYPRSELRELDARTGRNAAWSNRDRYHAMRMAVSVLHLPEVKPHAVIAQIHDGRDDIAAVRLQNRHLFLATGNGANAGTLTEDYRLGTAGRLTMVAVPQGVFVAYTPAGGAQRNAQIRGLTGTGWFFKAGMYVQAFAGQRFEGRTVPATAYGESVVYDLSLEHRPVAA